MNGLLPIDQVRAAVARAAPYVRRTTVRALDEGWLKLENQQQTGSFKIRGFASAVLAIPENLRERGFWTLSSGNGGRALAYMTRELGLSCRVVMSHTVAAYKRQAIADLGAEVFLASPEFIQSIVNPSEEAQNNLFPENYINPFGNEALMAGHGGIALELMEQVPDLIRILLPMGSGGLMVGIASVIRSLKPDVRIFGVQSDAWSSWRVSLAEGRPVQPNWSEGTDADGTMAPISEAMFARLYRFLSPEDIILVPEAEIERARLQLEEKFNQRVEGAGALAYAALQRHSQPGTVAIVSGGNRSDD